MAKSRSTEPKTPFMDSLFASLEASGALDAATESSANVPEPGEGSSPVVAPAPSAAESVGAAKKPIWMQKRNAARMARRTAGGERAPDVAQAGEPDQVADELTAQAAHTTPSGAITISALSTHILGLFERDNLLRDVWVVGEVSNWKRAASGHIYFSLKDAGATISAVMWRNAAMAHGWLPKEGDQILAHGYVGLYPERGSYQLYVNQIRPAGRGQLYATFEALKERLAAEGLFAAERKRPLPATVRRAAVITSRDGAALRDILRVASSRWPLLDLIIFPVQVQGSDSPAQIVAALASANRYSRTVEPIDVMILARGGGSIEDLWGFNDEQVARAIAASELPVVCGVGHETDFTIADFVADLRAATPSAAAMAITPDRADLLAELAGIRWRLSVDARALIEDEARHLEQHALRLSRAHPERALARQRQRLDEHSRALDLMMQRRLERQHDRVEAAAARLDALNPHAVLERGYSIVQLVSGRVVMGPEMSSEGDRLTVRAAHGHYSVVRATDSTDEVGAPN